MELITEDANEITYRLSFISFDYFETTCGSLISVPLSDVKANWITIKPFT